MGNGALEKMQITEMAFELWRVQFRLKSADKPFEYLLYAVESISRLNKKFNLLTLRYVGFLPRCQAIEYRLKRVSLRAEIY